MTLKNKKGLVYNIFKASSGGLAIIALFSEIKIGLCMILGKSNIACMICFLVKDLPLYKSFQIISCFLIKSIGLGPDFSMIFSISFISNFFFKYKTISKSIFLEFKKSKTCLDLLQLGLCNNLCF